MFAKFLTKNFTYPLRDIISKSNDMKYLNFLKKTENWTLSYLKKFQFIKFKKMILFSYHKVPYYRELMKSNNLSPDDFNQISDIRKLPFLTKEIIETNFNNKKLLSSKNSSSTLFKFARGGTFSSGGTTGNPLFYTRNSEATSWGRAAEFRGWSWQGFELGDKYSVFTRSPREIEEYNSLRYKLINGLRRMQYLPGYNLDDNSLENISQRLYNFQPRMIKTTPSAGYALADYFLRNKIKLEKLRVVLCSSEKLFDFQKERMERAFGCEIYNWYGSSEMRGTAFECSSQSGLHLIPENHVVEFIKDGNAVADGEIGELIITDLNNFAMPLIRYKIGDWGIPNSKKCDCGLPHPLMDEVTGRTRDFVVLKNGNMIPQQYFVDIFDGIDYVKNFKITQKDFQDIKIEIVPVNGFQKDYELEIQETLMQKTGLKFRVICCNRIKQNNYSGKKEFVISDVGFN